MRCCDQGHVHVARDHRFRPGQAGRGQRIVRRLQGTSPWRVAGQAALDSGGLFSSTPHPSQQALFPLQRDTLRERNDMQWEDAHTAVFTALTR